jgi:hypothetical protein
MSLLGFNKPKLGWFHLWTNDFGLGGFVTNLNAKVKYFLSFDLKRRVLNP